MRELAAFAGAAGFLWLVVAQPVQAAAPLSNQELAAQRGGIMTPTGLDIGFAASVRTYVDGALALETRLTWTDKGPVTETIGGLAGVSAAGLPNSWSAVSPGLTGGSTQILQDLSSGRIASVIVNSASNRNIRQDTDITLTLPQLQDMQRGFAAGRIASNLQGALALALPAGGAGH